MIRLVSQSRLQLLSSYFPHIVSNNFTWDSARVLSSESGVTHRDENIAGTKQGFVYLDNKCSFKITCWIIWIILSYEVITY